jgi:hypothetical protein
LKDVPKEWIWEKIGRESGEPSELHTFTLTEEPPLYTSEVAHTFTPGKFFFTNCLITLAVFLALM